MDQALIFRIRERAYQIWAANGGEAGQNWLCAETEILNTSAAQSPEAQPRKKQLGSFRRKAKKTASLG
jgi:hypothetical protein